MSGIVLHSSLLNDIWLDGRYLIFSSCLWSQSVKVCCFGWSMGGHVVFYRKDSSIPTDFLKLWIFFVNTSRWRRGVIFFLANTLKLDKHLLFFIYLFFEDWLQNTMCHSVSLKSFSAWNKFICIWRDSRREQHLNEWTQIRQPHIWKQIKQPNICWAVWWWTGRVSRPRAFQEGVSLLRTRSSNNVGTTGAVGLPPDN